MGKARPSEKGKEGKAWPRLRRRREVRLGQMERKVRARPDPKGEEGQARPGPKGAPTQE